MIFSLSEFRRSGIRARHRSSRSRVIGWQPPRGRCPCGSPAAWCGRLRCSWAPYPASR